MALRCGIVGLPNVGKSTLFNALSSAGAESANYPFCTIEPNVGVVSVPDKRLDRLAALSRSTRKTPATLELVDIAGLVEGASKGEGLGNQFLGHIREVDAIIHVVRCFEDPNIVHVAGSVDPERDIEIIQTELILKDLETLERRLERVRKMARVGDKEAAQQLVVLERLYRHLEEGKPARTFQRTEEEDRLLKELFLLTEKPVLYVANIAEEDLPEGNACVEKVREIARREGAEVIVISADLEAQIAELDEEEREAFLKEMGLEEPGLHRLIRAAYRLLGLITFFTTGPKETRAWTIREGTRAPQAAGVIHSDFERGFIRAETIAYEDFEAYGSEAAAREAGVMRSEGKEYVVKDGDVILFRFNV